MAFDNLFDDGDSGEEDCKISINKKYAEKFQKFKECQELDRLKEKYGEDSEETSTTSESEDEDAEGLTPQIEKDFLKTLAMIKEKDPKIYEKDAVFFTTDNVNDGVKENKQEVKTKQQPVFLKDYERQRLLEKGHKAYLSDSDDNDDEIAKFNDKNGVTYVEEQNQLQKSLISAAHSDCDSEDDLLQMRKDISEDAQNELGKSETLKGSGTGNALIRYWKNEEVDEDEKFLRDYILKKQFVDDTNLSKLPTYSEVTEDLDEDLDKEDEFERKFNFRFEDPDPEFIKQYPRTISESVRRKDDRRKHQRKEREERKKKEKEKKKGELKRLKNLKRKEIMEKIEKLKAITGNEKVGFLEEDMDGDFDISKYDQLMEKVFDDDYYSDEDAVEEEKPIFSEDEYFQEDENYDEYVPHCEDPDFNMDADYNPNDESKSSKKLTKNRGRNARFLEAIQRKKPLFDPQQKTFEEYFDEYYKLDFEDIIDDIPIRFKYREVIPNDFGLSTDEILKADDKELNEWCSLRKTMQYIGDTEEKKMQQKFKRKGRDKKKKSQVFTSLGEELLKESHEKINNSNKMLISKPRNIKLLQKKKKMLVPSWNKQQRRTILSTVNKSRTKHIRKQFKGGDNKLVTKLSLQRLAAYGLDEKKSK